MCQNPLYIFSNAKDNLQRSLLSPFYCASKKLYDLLHTKTLAYYSGGIWTRLYPDPVPCSMYCTVIPKCQSMCNPRPFARDLNSVGVIGWAPSEAYTKMIRIRVQMVYWEVIPGRLWQEWGNGTVNENKPIKWAFLSKLLLGQLKLHSVREFWEMVENIP